MRDADKTYFTRLERHLLHIHDQKITRCTHCGEWTYDRQDCPACLLPHPATVPDEAAS